MTQLVTRCNRRILRHYRQDQLSDIATIPRLVASLPCRRFRIESSRWRRMRIFGIEGNIKEVYSDFRPQSP